MNEITQDTYVAVFKSHEEAEEAIKALQHAKFDMTKLSIVARDYHTEEHVVGYYNAGDRIQYWGTRGAFWGGLWGLLFGSAFFWIPGLGPILLAGPLITWVVAALEGAVVVGGLSAFGAGLLSIGIPKDSIIQYETALTAGKFVLIANGSPDEISRAGDILHGAGALSVEKHEFKK